MEQCAAILNETLTGLNISDVMRAMGSKAAIKEGHMTSLLFKGTQEEFNKLPEDKKKAIQANQELYQQILSTYSTYNTRKNVSEALAEAAKETPKGLEKLLAAPEKKN